MLFPGDSQNSVNLIAPYAEFLRARITLSSGMPILPLRIYTFSCFDPFGSILPASGERVSSAYRPYHTHDVRESLIPGKVYELDVEIWPTCIVVPVGYRIALTVRGKDYEHPGKGMRIKSFVNEMRGCGPFLHNDPDDRPEALLGGRNTLFAGGRNPSFVLVPIIPKRNV